MTIEATHPVIQAFAFDSQAVRAVQIDGQPWFVAKDVCSCLGTENHRNAVAKLDPDEKGVQSLDTLGGRQETTVISESGVYAIILRSQGAMTPGTQAHTFRKWVTSEVLPAIRRTGRYSEPALAQDTQGLAAKLDHCMAVVNGLGEQTALLLAAVNALAGQTREVLALAGQMFTAMPKMLEAARPPARQANARKKMYQEDLDRLLALVAQGYLLHDLVEDTGFSQGQCYAVMAGRYKVLDSGRVSIDLRSELAKAADEMAKAQQAAGPGLWSVGGTKAAA